MLLLIEEDLLLSPSICSQEVWGSNSIVALPSLQKSKRSKGHGRSLRYEQEEKICSSYLTASTLAPCFRLPSVPLLLKADLDCCLPAFGIGAPDTLPSLLAAPLTIVVAILGSLDRPFPSPTTGAELTVRTDCSRRYRTGFQC